MDVSVIIPVYNVELYLQECLDSVLNQSGCSFEVICIDDGSIDSSPKILRNAAKVDSRIRVITQQNKGLSAARNAGLDIAQGRYLLFVDSDDMLCSQCLSSLVGLADRENLDHIVFGTDVFADNKNGVITHGQLNQSKEYYRIKDDSVFNCVQSGKELFALLIEKDSFYATTQLRFLSREIILKEGLRFADGLIHEDNHFTPLAMLLSRRAIVVADKYYLRRLRGGSIMTVSGMDIWHAACYFAVAVRLKDEIEDVSETDVNVERAIERYCGFLFELGWFYFSRDNTDGKLRLLLNKLDELCTEEEARSIRRIAFPLLAALDAANCRIRKYRTKRLSSRLKKIFKGVRGLNGKNC